MGVSMLHLSMRYVQKRLKDSLRMCQEVDFPIICWEVSKLAGTRSRNTIFYNLKMKSKNGVNAWFL